MRSSDSASSPNRFPGPCHEELVLSLARFEPVDFFETLRALESFVDVRPLVPPPSTHGHDGPTTTALEARTHQC